MKIFRNQPALTTKDRERLNKAGYLDGWNKLVRLLKDNPPNEADLKRLVVLELESGSPRKQILEKLIVQVQKIERGEINQAIRAACPKYFGI